MRLIAALCCFLLCACTTAQEALKEVESSYVGQKADQFFIAKGPPARSHKLSDGGMIYTWIGGVKGYGGSATTTINVISNTGGGASGTATTLGGRVISCTLDLHTDAQGTVRSIRVAEDTIGAWELSRCAEILKN